MKNKIKLLWLILFLGILIVPILLFFNNYKAKEVNAGTGHNVSGYAWSENIGWISFNNTSGGGSTDYGVDINETTGIFSGYAWSENIGWITFNAEGTDPGNDLTGCPSGDCLAKVESNYEVSGWARALAYGGGWDGWIKLRGVNYGVSINGAEFEGWAWGGDDSDSTAVIGWISFNCNNPETPTACSDSDYKVITSFVFNQPPQVQSPEIEYEKYCKILAGQGLVGFKWIYQDDDNDNESGFDFRVNDINNVNDLNYEVNRTYGSLNNLSGSVNTQSVLVKSPLEADKIAFGKTYYWWARVWDNRGGDSGWIAGPPVTTDNHAWPWPDFDPSPQNPSVDQVVEFIDISKCYNVGGSEYDCQNGGAGVSYKWDFDYDEAEGFTLDSTYKGNATTTYSVSQPYDVMLRITDDAGVCSIIKEVGVTLPLPEWEETAP